MANPLRVGIFSPNDPRPWVRAENLQLMLDHERALVNSLTRNGYECVRGGEGLPEQDQIAWSTELVHAHAAHIAAARPAVLIVNQGSWTFPNDSVDAINYCAREMGDIPRVVMFSYKDTQVPGLVAGMAAGGGLKRIGVPFTSVYGVIDQDPRAERRLLDVLEFYGRRADAAPVVHRALTRLTQQKFLALGGMALRMPTTTADVDQWQKLFGVSYEALDQSELVERGLEMVEWGGKPGNSAYTIRDPRVQKAVDFTLLGGHGTFDFSRKGLPDDRKYVLQLSHYYAALDVCEQYGITFAGIKCQDEMSARLCTVCQATAFLGNDVGPDGQAKPIIPVACECDMDSAMTQLWLYLLSGKPAGFGDFRDVEDGVLAIVNCGQHPPYFFGTAEEPAVTKLDRVEYLGQEVFYDAGGASVRGRTPGGQVMTVARLARENLRYYLAATVIKTLDVSPEEHKRYNLSWPIIRGQLPISDGQMIDLWPCNHLGFAYGDWTPHLVEMAQQLGIGFRVIDSQGMEYACAS
jgi:L-fucose isomerase-like protein